MPASGTCTVRLAGRPSDAAPVARGLAEAGGRLRAALPALGMVWAVVEEEALSGLAERAEQARFTLFVEHAGPECKAGCDVFAPLPDALPLMRALKSRFDPERVLNPGRFVGRI